MKPLMRKCPSCRMYTLQQVCPRCGGETVSPHPARFSPDDKYVRYRIARRYEESREGKGVEPNSAG